MINQLNKLYKNYNFIYKILLLLISIYLIVSMFPKSGKFKYSFENGKPWQSENLYAPFDFAILKTDAEYNNEVSRVKNNTNTYFNYTRDINKKDTLSNQVSKDSVQFFVELILYEIYQKGFLNSNYDFSADQKVSFLDNNVVVLNTTFDQLLKPENFYSFHKFLMLFQHLKIFLFHQVLLVYFFLMHNLLVIHYLCHLLKF